MVGSHFNRTILVWFIWSAVGHCGCSSLSSNSSGLTPRLCSAAFNLSVTVQTPEPWLQDQQEQQQQQRQLRLRIDIPKPAGIAQQQNHHQHNNHIRRRKSVTSEPMADPYAAVTTSADDDLQRLADSQRQLRLSGFYYGHLSWKESVNLLQSTPVRPSSP